MPPWAAVENVYAKRIKAGLLVAMIAPLGFPGVRADSPTDSCFVLPDEDPICLPGQGVLGCYPNYDASFWDYPFVRYTTRQWVRIAPQDEPDTVLHVVAPGLDEMSSFHVIFYAECYIQLIGLAVGCYSLYPEEPVSFLRCFGGLQ